MKKINILLFLLILVFTAFFSTITRAEGVIVVTFDDFLLSPASNHSLYTLNNDNPIYRDIVWDTGFGVFGEDYKICDDCPIFGIPHSGSFAITNHDDTDGLTITTPKILLGFWAGRNEYYGYGGGSEEITVYAIDTSGSVLGSVCHQLPDNHSGLAEPLEFVDTSAFSDLTGIQAYRIEPAEGCNMDCNWVADDFVFSEGVFTPVPDSGQNQSFTDTFGEDSDYSINPRSYTKLDADGNPLNDAASSWAMVRDNVTGLIWEVKTEDGTVHDRGNKYSWYDENPETNGGNAGTPGEGTDTQDYISALNAENFGGYSDWRLPTLHELTSLTDKGRNDPAVNTDYFPGTQSYWYWSSTTNAFSLNGEDAICVYFSAAYGNNIEKSNSGIFVRAVRSDMPGVEPLVRFVDNGDVTVSDRKTGLMFQQYHAEERLTWEDALVYCEDLVLAGFGDWRLPIIEELRAIVDYSRPSPPPVDADIFPDICGSYYWTSTTTLTDTGSAMAIYMHNGQDVSGADKNEAYYVLSVRAGGSNEAAAEDLILSIGAEPAYGRAPLSTTLSCTVVSGSPPFEYAWLFGDGTTGDDDENPSHTFENPGTYTATCTVVDSEGQSKTGAVVITVGEGFEYPDEYFVITDTSTVTVLSDTVYFVYGNAQANNLVIESGGRAKVMNFPGANTITIEAPSTIFTVFRSGATVTFEGTDGTLISLPATTDQQSVSFSDMPPVGLVIDAGEVMLGDQRLETTPALIDTVNS
ncbi:exported hypothetical protein [Desulfamplus magnetovallimortis]|uniref:PKD domain-containing protein n=1 Tax=Desulfamplus magnetovallimortis TaxID=1246637 RepID=A0A1W1HJC1_9BACT|nr:DUF1566 domain-containing protein [Desulfamplus magnetovallimortis]SLM32560.1 exported hypothetical protein [Desulfamplus magnetovallimortis]